MTNSIKTRSREIEVFDDETGQYLFSVELGDEYHHGFAAIDEDDDEELAILDKNGEPISFPFRTQRKEPIGFRMR
jgi:hypothetical protein